MRKNIQTNAPWEKIHGYSRAVIIGNQMEISGTVAVDDTGNVVGLTLEEQTTFILQKVEKLVTQAGFSMKDVIRTRIFVTHISDWRECSKVHSEFFGEVMPVSTMVEVNRLIDEKLLVEMEFSLVKT